MAETAMNLTNAAVPVTLETPATPPQTPPQTPPAKADAKPVVEGPKRKLKAGDKEIELTEADYERMAQKGFGSEKRLYEANKLQKEAMAEKAAIAKEKAELEKLRTELNPEDENLLDKLIAAAKNNPEKLAKVQAKMEQFLVNKYQQEAAPPEQQKLTAQEQRIKELEAEIEAGKAQKAEEAKKLEAQAFEKRVQEHRGNIEQQIIESLDVSGLPKTERTVKQMAELMIQANKAGVDLPPEKLASLVKHSIVEDNKVVFGEYSKAINDAWAAKDMPMVMAVGKALEEIMPPDLIKALRMYDLANLDSSRPKLPMNKPMETARETEPAYNPKKGSYPMTWDEMEAERKKTVQELERQFRSR